jgi:hypothetical protein
MGRVRAILAERSTRLRILAAELTDVRKRELKVLHDLGETKPVPKDPRGKPDLRAVVVAGGIATVGLDGDGYWATTERMPRTRGLQLEGESIGQDILSHVTDVFEEAGALSRNESLDIKRRAANGLRRGK